MDLHLLEGVAAGGGSTPRGEIGAGYPKYEAGGVVINKAGAGFDDVPEAVWNFHIGGYQVAHKWLKDRKGRELSDDDAAHYRKILCALENTIEHMQSIDAIIEARGGWPLSGSQGGSTPGDEEVKSFFAVRGEPKPPVFPANPPKNGKPEVKSKPPAEAPAKPSAKLPIAPQPEYSSLDDFADTDYIVAIRALFSDGEARDRETALRELSANLGFSRLGQNIREQLERALNTASRRGIIASEAGVLQLHKRGIADYSQDDCVQALCIATGRAKTDREDALRAFARHLGFARTGSHIRAAFKSAVNGAIRRVLIEYGENWIRRA